MQLTAILLSLYFDQPRAIHNESQTTPGLDNLSKFSGSQSECRDSFHSQNSLSLLALRITTAWIQKIPHCSYCVLGYPYKGYNQHNSYQLPECSSSKWVSQTFNRHTLHMTKSTKTKIKTPTKMKYDPTNHVDIHPFKSCKQLLDLLRHHLSVLTRKQHYNHIRLFSGINTTYSALSILPHCTSGLQLETWPVECNTMSKGFSEEHRAAEQGHSVFLIWFVPVRDKWWPIIATYNRLLYIKEMVEGWLTSTCVTAARVDKVPMAWLPTASP